MDKKIRVGVNGAGGRIGKLVCRALLSGMFPDMELVAVNVPSGVESARMAWLYDTAHGNFDHTVYVDGEWLVVDGTKRVFCYSSYDPSGCPWVEHNVDIVLECSGAFSTRGEVEFVRQMIGERGRVLMGSPAKDRVDSTVVFGVNHDRLKAHHKVVSAASCSTNALALLTRCLHQVMSPRTARATILHAYTRSQNTVDGSHRKCQRRARAAGENFYPTSSGAQKTLTRVSPWARDIRVNCFRVPVVDVSAIQLEFGLKRGRQQLDTEALNAHLCEASQEVPGLVGLTTDPLVSSDFIGRDETIVIDLLKTEGMRRGGDRMSVLAWFDNEWGYALQMLRIAEHWCRLIA